MAGPRGSTSWCSTAAERGRAIGAGGLCPAGAIRSRNSSSPATKNSTVPLSGKQVELVDTAVPQVEQLAIAARPCDAAGLPILDHVFNWDFQTRLQPPPRVDHHRHPGLPGTRRHCFCTSVGSAPDDPRGSDAMLYDLGDGIFEVRSLTKKAGPCLPGKRKRRRRSARSIPAAERFRSPAGAGPRRGGRVPGRRLRRPAVAGLSARCLGCGACAFTCPTCHCFDMVDEGNAAGGAKVRNWDACQFAMFTMHASGHNPRAVQRSGSGSGSTTSFRSIRRSSARCSAPVAAIARGIAPFGWACCRCWRRSKRSRRPVGRRDAMTK